MLITPILFLSSVTSRFNSRLIDKLSPADFLMTVESWILNLLIHFFFFNFPNFNHLSEFTQDALKEQSVH